MDVDAPGEHLVRRGEHRNTVAEVAPVFCSPIVGQRRKRLECAARELTDGSLVEANVLRRTREPSFVEKAQRVSRKESPRRCLGGKSSGCALPDVLSKHVGLPFETKQLAAGEPTKLPTSTVHFRS